MSAKSKSPVLEHGMYVSWGVAVVATLGSLYLSEVMKYTPCLYCWYQRILMYPLVVILGIAAVKKDHRQSLYVLPLAGMGILMSGYHYLVQMVPSLAEAGQSCGLIPCNVDYLNWFGFITIPLMAFVAFVLIFVFQVMIWRATRTTAA